jgi:hypothetical protein
MDTRACRGTQVGEATFTRVMRSREFQTAPMVLATTPAKSSKLQKLHPFADEFRNALVEWARGAA